jgi:tetratricopeptide (TPR) repeat protein
VTDSRHSLCWASIALAVCALVPNLSSQDNANGTANSQLSRAQQEISQHNPELAIKEYESVLAADPTNLQAQGNLGVLLFFANRCADAETHLSQALSVESGLDRLRALLGICEERDGKIGEAKRDLEASLVSLKDTRVRILAESNLVDLYYAEGDLQQASVIAAEFLKDDPKNPDAIYRVYRIHSDIAERAREALATVAPDSARMHQMMAEHFINEGDAADAITQYERALAADPGLPGGQYELAEAILADSTSAASLDRAASLLAGVLAHDPHNAGAEAKLGEIESIRGNVDAAQQRYLRALELDPSELDALKGMADVARRKEDAGQEKDYLSRASRVDPLDATLHYQLSLLFRKNHQEDEAKREMDLFVKIRNLKKKTELLEQKRESGK